MKPNFHFDKYGISADEIKAEADTLINEGIEAEKLKANPFPVEVFPQAIQDIVTATNETLNFPIDFIGASLLYAASVAIGNTVRAEIKRGWQESCAIYLAIVARAGTNKSHPLSFALQPIVERDKTTYRNYEQARQEFETNSALSKSERAEKGIGEPKKPFWRKFLLSDFTPEALAEVHKFNKRGIGVYVDELASWFKNFNRYNKGSEMEFWLSAWSGKPVNIDRKTGEPIFIPVPFISVAGTIQNGVLDELAKDSRNQNGFMDRILFVIPENLEKPYWNEQQLSDSVAKNWGTVLSNLLNVVPELDDTGNPSPRVLKFTAEAKDRLFEWNKNHTDEINAAESEVVRGIGSKMEMYVLRLSLILEMLFYSCGNGNLQAIGIDSVHGAIKLVDYFKKSAIRAHSQVFNASPLEAQPFDKQALYRALPTAFTTEEGLRIAEQMKVPERTFKRFLNDSSLFSHPGWGKYEKLIQEN